MIARSAGSLRLRLGQSAKRGSDERVGAADPGHQIGKLFFGHHREHQIALAGLEAVAGDLAGRGEIAELAVLVAGDGVFGDLRRDKGQRRVEHRDIDELPLAGMAALEQRARDREGGGHPADRVAQRKAGAGRAFILVAGDRHDPGHCLQLAVEGGGAALRPVLAKAGNGAIDQLRVQRAQRLVADAEAVHDAGPEVFPDDIGAFGELLTISTASGLVRSKGQAALVRIDAEEGRAEALSRPIRG